MHDLGAYRDGGGACHSLKLSDDEQVCHAVQGLQKVGQKIGERKENEIAEYASGCQIFFHSFFTPALNLLGRQYSIFTITVTRYPSAFSSSSSP